jgi:cohesin loading factor subunit SCC2
MADPMPDIYNGPPHGISNSAPHGAQPPPTMAFTRPFTLYEALPYTPFSAIAPFDSSRPARTLPSSSAKLFYFAKLLFRL